MLELNNNLQNGIFQDGQLVFGDVSGNGSIGSLGSGAFAHGYVDGDSYIIASNKGAHAEGYACTYYNQLTDTTIRYVNIASGEGAHAEGCGITASGDYSHAEGALTCASGNWSHAEGCDTEASGNCSHAEGHSTTASGDYSHAEGHSTTASNICAHAEGGNTDATGNYSHAEGQGTDSTGVGAHAEGNNYRGSIIAEGIGSHAEGCTGGLYQEDEPLIYAFGNGSHAEGYADDNGSIVARGNGSHAEGYVDGNESIVAEGIGSHAEGHNTDASGNYSHAEGDGTCAFGNGSHSEGEFIMGSAIKNFTINATLTLSGKISISAEDAANNQLNQDIIGYFLKVNDQKIGVITDIDISVAGSVLLTTAPSLDIHHGLANNFKLYKQYNGVAAGDYSHASGSSFAAGKFSFSCGHGTIADCDSMLAAGKFNAVKPDTLFVVGNGSLTNGSLTNGRSNVFRVTDTSVYSNGQVQTSGADYAEYFEWVDGNPENEERVGHFVTLDSSNPEKIKFANANVTPIGIVSSMPSMIANSASEEWIDKYEKDIFGRYIYEDIEIEEKIEVSDEELANIDSELDIQIDENSKKYKIEKHIEKQRKLNPEYDPSKKYVSREQRKEWSPVGLLGQIIVIDDGTCIPGQKCSVKNGGIATNGSDYMVLKRLDDTHIKVLFK